MRHYAGLLILLFVIGVIAWASIDEWMKTHPEANTPMQDREKEDI